MVPRRCVMTINCVFPLKLAQVAREAFDIPVVQRGVDLVEHAERRRPHLQNGKIQRDGDKGLLAAGQQRDGLELLAGRLHANFNAARQRLRVVSSSSSEALPPPNISVNVWPK